MWKHKDLWKQCFNTFCVEISRHSIESNPTKKDGGNRWAIYIYIYPSNKYFELFKANNWACSSLFKTGLDIPLHKGQSYAVEWINKDFSIASIQIGCDYNHEYDEYYSFYTKDDIQVFIHDAQKIIDWLKEKGCD